MKKHLVFLLLFITFNGVAQRFYQRYNESPATVKENVYTEDLERFLDSLTLDYNTPLHGRFNQIDIDINNANVIQVDHSEFLSWKFETQNAGIRIYFSELFLGDQDTLFFVSPKNELLETVTKKDLIGTRFTSKPSIHGQLMYLAHNSGKAKIKISGYSNERLNKDKTSIYGFGDSDNCQINASCYEGSGYSDVRRSIVRILVKVGPAFGWCTGSVVNNTKYDFQPYVLTAEHCAMSLSQMASEEDLKSWTFYFNYESDACINPDAEGNLDNNRLTGASLVAHSEDNGGDYGSDFLLLRLIQSIPADYNVYYAGWNNNIDDIPQRGASIHHPSGDIRKISTFYNPTRSGSFGSFVHDTHWVVNWSQTLSGYGTTEGGSSGSPLFDENKLICGVLTGGASMCSYPDQPDYYGKFGYSWNQNGTAIDNRLDTWLDPDNLGYKALNGANFQEDPPQIEDNLKVYPVPANDDFLTIENVGLPQDNLSFSLFDVNGSLLVYETVVSLPGEKLSLDISEYQNGFYVLLLERNGVSIEKKVVIAR